MTLEKFIDESFYTYRTNTLTQQVFDRLIEEIPKLFAGQPVATDVRGITEASVNTGNQIAISGEKRTVKKLESKMLDMILKFERQIQEEKRITTVVVPNIMEYQMNYLKEADFFKRMIDVHKVKSFTGDSARQNVTIRGQPASVDAVQKDIFDLLPKVTNSKVSTKKRPTYLNVFKAELAQETIRKQLLTKRMLVFWCLDNKTISVYSDSKALSQAAMDCINNVVWEAQYPADRDLDESEQSLLKSPLWTSKKTELQQQYDPLEIVQVGDRAALELAGLMHVKASITESVRMFFDQNVKRTMSFDGAPERTSFLERFRKDVFKDVAQEHNVVIDKNDGETGIKITGAKDNIANCARSLRNKYEAICKDIHVIEHESMIQLIKQEPEFLDSVGLKTLCLVVPHADKDETATAEDEEGPDGNRYTLPLPTGTVCEVRKDDITLLGCDAIVNAANGDLQHIGGLAKSVAKKGTLMKYGDGCSKFSRKRIEWNKDGIIRKLSLIKWKQERPKLSLMNLGPICKYFIKSRCFHHSKIVIVFIDFSSLPHLISSNCC